MDAQPIPDDNPYNANAATLPVTNETGGGGDGGGGYIHSIEPQFNDSHPAQTTVDYTAPQQPYYLFQGGKTQQQSQENNFPPSTNNIPNGGYVGSNAFVRNFDFLKTIPGVLNIIALVS